MDKINKIDYFVGAFLSAIINKAPGIVPALFEETDESKKLEFETNEGKYNIYIKYSTSKHQGKRNPKNQIRVYWNVAFSDNEYKKLKRFQKEEFINYIAVVCTIKELTDTKIAILNIDKVLNFLENTPDGKQKRITIYRYGAESNFNYKGTGCLDKESEKSKVDFMSYFE